MRAASLCLLVCLVPAGCGLISDDIARVDLRFPKHDFRVDSADWHLVGTTVPSVPCAQVNCEAAAALFCGSNCSASCDTGTNTCQAAVTITLVNDFDLAKEAPEYQKIADQPVISVSIDDVYFDITENTFTVDTPALVVFVGPPSVTEATSAGAERVGTIPAVVSMNTGRATITFEGNGRAILARYMNDFHTPFRVGVTGTVALRAGDKTPTGRLVGSVQADAHAGL